MDNATDGAVIGWPILQLLTLTNDDLCSPRMVETIKSNTIYN